MDKGIKLQKELAMGLSGSKNEASGKKAFAKGGMACGGMKKKMKKGGTMTNTKEK